MRWLCSGRKLPSPGGANAVQLQYDHYIRLKLEEDCSLAGQMTGIRQEMVEVFADSFQGRWESGSGPETKGSALMKLGTVKA